MDQCITKHVYMYIQWTCVLYSVVIKCCNPPISQFNSLCNEVTSVWSMFVYNEYFKYNVDVDTAL